MKEKRCRDPIEDIIWKKSLCPCVLSPENINKLKVSKVHNRYLAHWGTDWTWKSENNLVGFGLLWFGRKWWAVPCLSSTACIPCQAFPPGAGSRNGTGVQGLQNLLGASSLQHSEKPTLFTLCADSRLFSLRRIWDKTQSVLLPVFHLQVKVAWTRQGWCVGDVKNQWCHLPSTADWLWLSGAVLLCNRNEWLLFNQSGLW